ncbi:hypothetical protein SCG7086_AH_00240 [Chlamydiales bacterium SCGC AG-110-P3]|nr:hypothetical protein SCG7086_AH_00240 [Chlamydiales bacterium SCGC AG-110-P3]
MLKYPQGTPASRLLKKYHKVIRKVMAFSGVPLPMSVIHALKCTSHFCHNAHNLHALLSSS